MSEIEIIIRNTSDQPIYEQICSQLKAHILSGVLSPGDPLPSIRALARDLRISVITTKRAYEELERAGFIHVVPAKGCFVAEANLPLIREDNLRRIEELMRQILPLANTAGVTLEQLCEMLRLLFKEGDL